MLLAKYSETGDHHFGSKGVILPQTCYERLTHRFNSSQLHSYPFLLAPSLTLHALNTEFNPHLQTATSFSTWYAPPPQSPKHGALQPCVRQHDSSSHSHLIESRRQNTDGYLKLKKRNHSQSGSCRLSRPAVAGLASFANKITFINESCRCVAMETKHFPEKRILFFVYLTPNMSVFVLKVLFCHIPSLSFAFNLWQTLSECNK